MPRRKENSHVALFSAFEGMWAEQAGCALFDSSRRTWKAERLFRILCPHGGRREDKTVKDIVGYSQIIKYLIVTCTGTYQVHNWNLNSHALSSRLYVIAAIPGHSFFLSKVKDKINIRISEFGGRK